METAKKLAEKLGFRVELTNRGNYNRSVIVTPGAPVERMDQLAVLWRECLKLMADQEAAESENKRLREALEKYAKIVHAGRFHQWKDFEVCPEPECKDARALRGE